MTNTESIPEQASQAEWKLRTDLAATAIDKARQQSTGPMADMAAERLAWPALLRRLDRVDPGFRC